MPTYTAGIYLFKFNHWKHQNIPWNLFKVNNRETKTTSMTWLSKQLYLQSRDENIILMGSKLQEIHQNKSSLCVFIVTFDLIHPIDLLSSGNFHCVRSVRIRSYSGPHFSRIFPHLDWIRRDTRYLCVFSSNAGKCGRNADQNNSYLSLFSPNVGKCGKNAHQDNSEYPHFLQSVYFTIT